jgi:hypothetical protein
MSFIIPYIYDFITKLCKHQAEVTQNYENDNVNNFGQDEAIHRNYMRLNFGGGQAYNRASD